MAGEISLRTILWVLAALAGCAALALVGRAFHTCYKRKTMRAALEHFLCDEEPPHRPH